jgi:choriolysin H
MVFKGSQGLHLNKAGCLHRSVIVHEFLHAIGFNHEQTRKDRDQFVKVNFENITPGNSELYFF